MKHRDRMRCPSPRIRRTTVLLLLALRADERSVRPQGGLRGSRRLRGGEGGSPPPDGRLPPEGGTGVRATASTDRGPRRVLYLCLEVRRLAVTRSAPHQARF